MSRTHKCPECRSHINPIELVKCKFCETILHDDASVDKHKFQKCTKCDYLVCDACIILCPICEKKEVCPKDMKECFICKSKVCCVCVFANLAWFKSRHCERTSKRGSLYRTDECCHDISGLEKEEQFCDKCIRIVEPNILNCISEKERRNEKKRKLE
jgi:hypothetical protein